MLTDLGLLLQENQKPSGSQKLVSPLEDMNTWQRDMSDESQAVRDMLKPI